MKPLNQNEYAHVSGGACDTPACQTLQCDIAVLQAKIGVLNKDYDDDAMATSLQEACSEFGQMDLGDVKSYLKLLRRKHLLKQELDSLRGWE